MMSTIVNHTRPFKQTLECYVFYIVFLIGGSQQCLATTYARRRNTKVVVIDCEEEVNKHRALYQKYGIAHFSLGRRETLLTLCRDASPEIHEAACRSAGMMAREGAGGAPAAAYLAATKLVNSEEFQGFNQALIPELICATQGRPEAVVKEWRFSIPGGTGVGAALPIVDATNRDLQPLGIPILDTFQAIGPIAFTGLSFVGDMNSAAVLGDYVERLTDKSDPERDRIVSRLHLVEYLPVGTNLQLRNKLIRLDDQAMRSLELQECLLRIAPNLATLGELGNLRTRDLELFAEIDQQREVLPTVAHNLSKWLADALSSVAADPLMVREVRWEPTSRALNRPTIDEIVQRAREFDTGDLITAITQPTEEVSYEMYLDMGPRGEFDLTKLDAYYSAVPETLSEAVQRLVNLATFEVVVDQEAAEVTAAISHCEATIAGLVRKLEQAHRQLVHPGFLQQCRSAEKKLATLAVQLSKTCKKLVHNEARLATLLRSQDRVQKEHADLQDRIGAAKAMLGKLVPRGRDSFYGRYVVVSNLEDCFGDLLRLTLEPEAEQRDGLCGLATLVTMEGLAHCVGSPTPKIQDIAPRIVFGAAKLKCPPHGAYPRSDRVVKVYCLPPLSATFAEPTREAILKLDPTAVVVFNDDTHAGITVSRYEFRGFANAEQLMVGLVRYGAKRLEHSPIKALRYPTGVERMPQRHSSHESRHSGNGAATEPFRSY